MRTVRTKVYQFSELSETAQQTAIAWYRNSNDNDFYADEIIGSIKKVAELFNLKFGRQYTDVRYSHIDDNILELKGVRLYKYLVNNYYSDLFTPAYIKSIDRPVKWRQFICKVHKGIKGEYTQLYSKIRTDNSCVLTGICFDNDILQPVYDFLAKIDTSTTFEDLIKDIESAISKTFSNNEDWINSDEYITGEIEANGYEFTVDGNRF